MIADNETFKIIIITTITTTIIIIIIMEIIIITTEIMATMVIITIEILNATTVVKRDISHEIAEHRSSKITKETVRIIIKITRIIVIGILAKIMATTDL